MSATAAVTAASFLDEIGVDTHIPYTDGGYANLSNVQADLNYLGVKELRDGISTGVNGSAPLSSYIALAEAGEKFTFVVGTGASTPASIQSTLDAIAQLVAAVPGSVKAIEGPNEINNQETTFKNTGDPMPIGGIDGAVALQRYLYQAVKSMPTLAGVAVDYFTGYDTIGFAAGPNPSTVSGLADNDTQHPYPNYGQAPAHWVDPSTALPNEPGAKGSFVYTETGYTTNLSDVGGVDATVQGKYTLDLLMDAAKDGSSGTYLYQLMDAYKPGSPQGDDGYGLFDENNKPKLAAIGIHNLAGILADTGPTASNLAPPALNYSVSGLPSTGNSLEIDKSDGTTDIAVWAEPEIWNETTESEVAAPAETVTMSLGTAHAVAVYDPLVGTAPIATYGSTDSIQLQITDHPLIVEIDPLVASTGTPITATDKSVSTTDSVTPNTVPITTATVTNADTTATVTNADTTAATAAPSADGTAANTSGVVSSLASSIPPVVTDPLANATVTAAPPMISVTVHANGSSTVDVQGSGQTIGSTWHDTFLNHGMSNNTFVFDPGFESDVVRQFRVNGTDHDSLSLLGSDFDDSIATVLHSTTMVGGSAVITDPTSGDKVRLTGVTKGQLVANRGDITFHA